MAARIVPFGLYALFLLIGQIVGWLGQVAGWPALSGDAVLLWLYPIKTLVVAAALAWFWRQYD
ncbi:MAG: hypothetical protein JNK03_12410, partial [Nitrospira sp.]|nr:hypothetical protein [Nitrospira sp.]